MPLVQNLLNSKLVQNSVDIAKNNIQKKNVPQAYQQPPVQQPAYQRPVFQQPTVLKIESPKKENFSFVDWVTKQAADVDTTPYPNTQLSQGFSIAAPRQEVIPVEPFNFEKSVKESRRKFLESEPLIPAIGAALKKDIEDKGFKQASKDTFNTLLSAGKSLLFETGKTGLNLLRAAGEIEFEGMGVRSFDKKRSDEKFLTNYIIRPIEELSKKQFDISTGIEGEIQSGLFQLANGASSLALALGVTYITKNPELAAGLLSSIESFPKYTESRNAGNSVEKSLLLAGSDFAAVALLEGASLNMILKSAKKEAASLFVRGIEGAAKEGLTESAQNTFQNWTTKIGIDDSQEIFEGFTESLIVAGIVGGTVAITAPSVQKSIEKFEKQMVKSGATEEEAKAFTDEYISYLQNSGKNMVDNINNPFKENRTAGLFGMDKFAAGQRPGIEKPAPLPDVRATTFKNEGFNQDYVARQIYNIDKLPVISKGGSDRLVFDLGGNKVLKVAKTARGLSQNYSEVDGFVAGTILPDSYSSGKNYVVVEKVDFKKDREKINKLTKFLQSGDVRDARGNAVQWKIHPVLEEAEANFEIEGLSDLANYDLLWNDLTAARNWGVSAIDGRIVHADGGTLNANILKVDQELKNEFDDIKQENKSLQEQFNDMPANEKASVKSPYAFLGGDKKLTPQQVYERSTKISNLENQIKNIYKEAGQSKDYPEVTKAEEVLYEIYTEMDNSKAGFRIQDQNTGEFSGVDSTFPQWVPDDLRLKSLFNKVVDSLDINSLKFPSGNKPKQRALYNVILDELDSRLGVNTESLRKQVVDGYDIPVANNKNGTTSSSNKSNVVYKSKVYERMENEIPVEARESVGYTKENLVELANNAAKLIKENRDDAYRIATGMKEAPKGQTSAAVNIVMAEKALADGDYQLYSSLVRNRSIAQTRRGQEIVSEKLSVTDNNVARYVKDVIGTRLEKLGDGYLAGVDKIKGESKKQRAIKIIDKEVKKAKQKISRSKEMDIQEAQSIIDKLICK